MGNTAAMSIRAGVMMASVVERTAHITGQFRAPMHACRDAYVVLSDHGQVRTWHAAVEAFSGQG